MFCNHMLVYSSGEKNRLLSISPPRESASRQAPARSPSPNDGNARLHDAGRTGISVNALGTLRSLGRCNQMKHPAICQKESRDRNSSPNWRTPAMNPWLAGAQGLRLGMSHVSGIEPWMLVCWPFARGSCEHKTVCVVNSRVTHMLRSMQVGLTYSRYDFGGVRQQRFLKQKIRKNL